MAHLNARLANFYIQWPDDATRTLIECRRVAQPNFCSTPIHSQKRLWRVIARDINNIHAVFAPTRRQCRNKWNALKSGYENLKRLLNGNPDGFPLILRPYMTNGFMKNYRTNFGSSNVIIYYLMESFIYLYLYYLY